MIKTNQAAQPATATPSMPLATLAGCRVLITRNLPILGADYLPEPGDLIEFPAHWSICDCHQALKKMGVWEAYCVPASTTFEVIEKAAIRKTVQTQLHSLRCA